MTTTYHLMAVDEYVYYVCGVPLLTVKSFGYHSTYNFLCVNFGDKCSACVEIATLMQLADATL
jgi:hypothetical protein